jgi:uncharacterized membrane protein
VHTVYSTSHSLTSLPIIHNALAAVSSVCVFSENIPSNTVSEADRDPHLPRILHLVSTTVQYSTVPFLHLRTTATATATAAAVAAAVVAVVAGIGELVRHWPST